MHVSPLVNPPEEGLKISLINHLIFNNHIRAPLRGVWGAYNRKHSFPLSPFTLITVLITIIALIS